MTTELPVPKIRSVLRTLLAQRIDVTRMACQQRAKFEGWIKFELASALSHDPRFDQIILEDGYSISGRADLSFVFQGVKWYVELKTANANWRADGLQNRTRPITKNINGIADDILILRQKSPPDHGLAIFCIFPVPLRLWEQTREQLAYHLDRIEEMGQISENTLLREVEYVSVAEGFGVCAFVVDVT